MRWRAALSSRMRRVRSTTSASDNFRKARRTRLARLNPLRPISSAGVNIVSLRRGRQPVAPWRYNTASRFVKRQSGGTMNAQEAYAELLRRSREQALLASCSEILAWDEETYMPPGGV